MGITSVISVKTVVARQNGFHGPQFRANRGTTQGVIPSPTLCDVEVYSMVHNCMSLTVEYESTTHEVLGMAVGWCMGVFYADERMIVSMDPK